MAGLCITRTEESNNSYSQVVSRHACGSCTIQASGSQLLTEGSQIQIFDIVRESH